MNVVNELTDTCKTILREKCLAIDKVYENQKYGNLETITKDSEILYTLCILLSGDENQPEDYKRSNYVAHYLANNNVLTSRLVQIVADSEDLQIRSGALEIIYTLLTNTLRNSEEDIKAFKTNLSIPPNFCQLLESIYSFHSNFSNMKYVKTILELQTKLIHILLAVSDAKICRDICLNASTDTVRLLGTLLSTDCYKNSKLVGNLLHLLNILCHKKKNCEILASSKFFDALSSAYKITKKILTIVSILKAMSRNEKTLYCMTSNVNVVKILLEMLHYSGKKHLNKRSIITILYRITKTDQGLEILKIHENYQSLLEWIRKNQKYNKMATIKAYTMLNRTVTKAVLNPKGMISYGHGLNDMDEASSSEESVGEHDSDDDSQSIPENDVENERVTYRPEVYKALEYLPEMKIYFEEIFNSKSTCNLKTFENIGQMSGNGSGWRNIIEQRINRNELNNKHNYADSEILEEEFDEQYLNPNSNELNVELLVKKFQCAKGIQTTNFSSRLVYDVHKDYSHNCNNLTLKFDSHFECGNLERVIQTDEFEYELMLNGDTGSCKGLQWFYFQISNMEAGPCYTFNIVNFMKVNSQYNYGMQPLLFSVTDYIAKGIGWRRVGENIAYFGNNYTNHNGTLQYRTLTFSVSFKYTNDCVYFAYHYPYTYTRLMTILYSIYSNNSNSVYKRVDKLCNTINNNEVPLLTITAAANKSKSPRTPITERPIILITARVHPGETNSSWIAEGMIKFLLNETNEEACKIREYFIFKIIPMLNIEGVICGNTRSGIFGNDLNRCWADPKQNSCSEIYYTKKLIEYVRKGLKQEVAACIDIHGHSRKKFFFFYGCNPKMSWNQEDWKKDDCLEAIEVLPQITSLLNPHIQLNFCRYRVERSRESTARVVFWREFGIQNSYTLECSYCAGDSNKTINTKILTEIGANVVAALGLMRENNLKNISTT